MFYLSAKSWKRSFFIFTSQIQLKPLIPISFLLTHLRKKMFSSFSAYTRTRLISPYVINSFTHNNYNKGNSITSSRKIKHRGHKSRSRRKKRELKAKDKGNKKFTSEAGSSGPSPELWTPTRSLSFFPFILSARTLTSVCTYFFPWLLLVYV